MAKITATAEEAVGASSKVVYRYLADYRQYHPLILPPAFSDFLVEAGGVGAGTIISFKVKLGGKTRVSRQRVDEPQPGRILRERDLEGSTVTTFTVSPDGKNCRVKIETVYEGANGVAGLIERLLAPRMLAKLYREELARLDKLARGG
ncbi:MAG TPA: SRPBCC family protein [Thermomicrobiales bacterium]|jgi:hypothetical protein